MISARPAKNSSRLRQTESSEYAPATRSGSRVFQASSAAWTFCRAVSSVKGGNGGRGDMGLPPPHAAIAIRAGHYPRGHQGSVRAVGTAPRAGAAPARRPTPGPAGSGGGPGLLDGELGRGVCLEAIVGDRQPAANRAAVGAVVQPLQGPVEGGQPVPQALRDGIVHAFGDQVRRGVRVVDLSVLVLRLSVLARRRLGASEQVGHLGALGLQPRPCFVMVHPVLLVSR